MDHHKWKSPLVIVPACCTAGIAVYLLSRRLRSRAPQAQQAQVESGTGTQGDLDSDGEDTRTETVPRRVTLSVPPHASTAKQATHRAADAELMRARVTVQPPPAPQSQLHVAMTQQLQIQQQQHQLQHQIQQQQQQIQHQLHQLQQHTLQHSQYAGLEQQLHSGSVQDTAVDMYAASSVMQDMIVPSSIEQYRHYGQTHSPYQFRDPLDAEQGGVWTRAPTSQEHELINPMIGASYRLQDELTMVPSCSFLLHPIECDPMYIQHKTQLKKIAGAMAGRMRKHESFVMPFKNSEAMNHGIKSLCLAKAFLQSNNISFVCRAEYNNRTESIHVLVQPVPLLADPEPTSDDQIIRVAGKTAPPPIHSAGLIANRLREYSRCYLLCMGAESICQALRSLTVTHNFLIQRDIPLYFRPQFLTITRQEGQRSAIRILCEQRTSLADLPDPGSMFQPVVTARATT